MPKCKLTIAEFKEKIGLYHKLEANYSQRIEAVFTKALEKAHIPLALASELLNISLPLAFWVFQQRVSLDKPLVVGINGAQGTGKSTYTKLIQLILKHLFNQPSMGFSLDDIYLTHEQRKKLARDIHPLLQTRGVPGTHNIPMGFGLVERAIALTPQETMKIPVFDKARDDLAPESTWPVITGPLPIIFIEGWCIGAPPQPAGKLVKHVNALESDEDPEGVWRRYVNYRLSTDYGDFFALLSCLIFLQAPSMEKVYEWRLLQEQKLIKSQKKQGASTVSTFNPKQLERFIMHFERLTRYMIAEMPKIANVTLILNQDHQTDTVFF